MFYDVNSDFPFLLDLEKNWLVIKSEISALGESEFEDYEHSKDGGWKIMLFVMLDRVNEKFAKACPETIRLLQNIPNLTFAAVSKLKSHSSIHPHKEWIKNEDMLHYNNGNLHRAHLGLQIPKGDIEDCGIRVGEKARQWEIGKCLMFDDNVEHEVWNNTDEDRIVMVIDFIKDGHRLLETEQIRALKKQMIDLHM